MSGESEVRAHGVPAYSYQSLKCSDIGYPDCSHVAYGATESALFRNAEYHAIHTHGYTKESWEKELSEKLESFRNLIKMSTGAG
jgi:predicted small metal-binding protein